MLTSKNELLTKKGIWHEVLFFCCSLQHSCKNIPEIFEKELWAEWASVDKWALCARMHVKSLVQLNWWNEKNKNNMKWDAGCWWAVDARGRISGLFPCSRMQKHFRNGMIYAKVRHLMNGLCWHFDTVAKLNILCQLLGENVAYGIGVHPPKLGNPYSTQW